MLTDPLPLLAQSPRTMLALQHLFPAIFVFCFGGAVGSFINVVNYRLPAGMSITTPPSRCPVCGARLKFFRENLPILGWFLCRGRCRYCGVRISPEYMVLEVVMALLFLGLYVLMYVVPPSVWWWGEIGGPWWYFNGFTWTWPAFFALAFLLAALISMTIIDARTFTIPIQVPVFVTVVAFGAYAVQALLSFPSQRFQSWPIPGVGWTGACMALGGLLGTLIATALLRAGVFRFSFADYHEHVGEGEVIGDYPHARREMWVELKFLAPCLLGLAAGWVVGRLAGSGPPPRLVQALGAAGAGYLVGGGLIWAIRILGTLAFGREAMGLGDVHLLGAVGAVLGWLDPVLVFFVAPFSGLAWALLSMGLGRVFRSLRRELPYGPHLALATVVVLLCRPGIDRLWVGYAPLVPIPARSLVTSPAPPPVPTAPREGASNNLPPP